jgi:hypothetical protein
MACRGTALLSFLKEKNMFISPSCQFVCVCLSVFPHINFWTAKPILTKLTMHVVSLKDILTEPIQFLKFENYDRNKFLKSILRPYD